MTQQNRMRLMERKIVEQLVSGKSFNAVCRDLKVGRNRVSQCRLMQGRDLLYTPTFVP